MSKTRLAEFRVVPLKVGGMNNTPTILNSSFSVSNYKSPCVQSMLPKKKAIKKNSLDSILSTVLGNNSSKSSINTPNCVQKQELDLPIKKPISRIKHSISKSTSFPKPHSDSFSEIEIRFQDNLNRKKMSGLTTDLFLEFQLLFEEIISVNSSFSLILKGIKEVYEEWINLQIRNIEDGARLKQKIVSLEKKVDKETKENESLYKQLKDIHRENLSLGQKNQVLTDQCKELQMYLSEISDVNLDEIPNEKLTWKSLIVKNKKYKEKIEKNEEKLKLYKENIKMNLTLFASLSELGFPIKSLYKKFLEEDDKSCDSSDFEKYENESNKNCEVMNRSIDNIEYSWSNTDSSGLVS